MSPARRRSGTILIVEDDPTLRTFYRSALMLAGFWVVTASDGIEALQKVEGYEPSAVVLDLGLPRMGGADVGRELAARQTSSPIPIIIVTGLDTRGLDERQFARILRKPISADTLIRAVEEAVDVDVQH